jgi:hypothetical protein
MQATIGGKYEDAYLYIEPGGARSFPLLHVTTRCSIDATLTTDMQENIQLFFRIASITLERLLKRSHIERTFALQEKEKKFPI